jgi:ribA/ribD-fused uncharacterized protein
MSKSEAKEYEENSVENKKRKICYIDSNSIKFYYAKKEYGYLSNFYGKLENKMFSLEINGFQWNSLEHYFQASKFMGPNHSNNESSKKYVDLIRMSSTPNIAKVLACQKIGGGYPWRTKLNPAIQLSLFNGVTIRSDWENTKDDIMLNAVLAKFSQNSKLASLLLQTEEVELVEHSKRDSYWGDGGDGSGQNKLGSILMQVRTVLRNKK